ncbi:MAG: mechanosensitive ion channel [SAR324 cluster bacterium]|nr:mechanosensitive ion channel [SAR324 cluster bacterium]
MIALEPLLEQITVAFGNPSLTFWGVLRFLMILALTLAFSKGLRWSFRYLGNRVKFFKTWSTVPDNYFHYALLPLGGLAALSGLGINLANFAFLSGFFGLVLGFSIRSWVNNFVSGLILLLEQPLKIGDFIEMKGGAWGRVTAIHLRSTQISTFDKEDILIPNAELISAPIINRTYKDPTRRVHIPFRVPYGIEPPLVVQAATEAAKSVKYTLQKRKKHQPQVWLVGLGAIALDYELVVWVKRNVPLYNAYLKAIRETFQKYQIVIPFPQTDLNFIENSKSTNKDV